MNKYTKKQMELVERINETADKINEAKSWIGIASYYCNCEEDEDFAFKMGLILNILNEQNSKLYDYVDNLLCDLSRLI